MELLEFFTNLPGPKSDKGTAHSYIENYYTQEFSKKQKSKLNILEIGIQYGYSLQLWRDFFINSKVQGIEFNKSHVYNNLNVKFGDAYHQETLDLYEDNYFDYIIDDGPHSLSSQLYAAEKWVSKIKKGGKLIIEDIDNLGFAETIINSIDKTKYDVKLFDMIASKNRWDDIIIEITKL